MPVPNPDRYKADITVSNTSFTFCKPTTTHEIVSVGRQMNHCVGSYADMVVQSKVEIVTATDTSGKPLVCIEIKNKEIRQAKLSNNRKASEIKDINKAVIAWAEMFKLAIATKDIR